ncbi:MAG TPA: phosphoenolpyruvate synthase [Candidatus Vogelbacteria bacterium]|nr:phosphoenolpyruvate synthase [Candidatus Vogelbacteria bacterium]
MSKDKKLILWFDELGSEDVPLVGGKNASLGEMYRQLSPLGVRVPNGFAVTSYAYNRFIDENNFRQKLEEILKGLDTHNIRDLGRRGKLIRDLIRTGNIPEDMKKEILLAYEKLSGDYKQKNTDVAVRSSATAEDLPDASFAGQQETYLNIKGEKELLDAVRNCFASLFTNRAISYRTDKGFSHFDVSLSVAVQKMVRSDLASSGVAFSLDTETGFDKVVMINSSYGLGEMVVQGAVTPDEFIVFKPTLEKGYKSILSKTLGKKDIKMIYGNTKNPTKKVPVPVKDRDIFSLIDDDIITLAAWTVTIEKYFSKKKKKYQPMDIEWAKDGKTGELFIVQARPETVHSMMAADEYKEYILEEKGKEILRGTAVGAKIASGKVRVILSASKINDFKPGEVLVTEITDPDWEPIMKIASAIITDKGGRTSHAAIVSRELGIPCIVGSGEATKKLKNGQMVTIDCSFGDAGIIYQGELKHRVKIHKLGGVPETKTKVTINIGSPEEAFRYHYLPAKGVGLGRLEFIISSYIRIHPRALLEYESLRKSKDAKKKKIAKVIEEMAKEHKNKKDYYISELAEGIAKIGAAFWPEPAIIRFSDFKTNEYRTLIGGELYEPEEENPMIGWRGASRYYHPDFEESFCLECQALAKVRNEIGLKNVLPMIPFCRTVEEGEKVLKVMSKNGLDRKKDKDLKVYVMCEIPSNIIQADKFLDIFDGMSIGSNDLTQLVLGLDRDSAVLAGIANENHPAVKDMIAEVIEKCRQRKKYIGICGQAPSDYPEFAQFLVEKGIETVSLNPDTVLKTILAIAETEKKMKL